MARETKRDRIVRAIMDQVVEHLHELNGLVQAGSTKEVDVERWSASFLKACLGYTASAGFAIKSQETKGRSRPDLVVTKSEKPIFLVEVKKLGFDFDRSDFRSGKTQLSQYLQAAGGVRFGMLTNGTEWRLYDFANVAQGGTEIARFDLCGEDGEAIPVDRKTVEDLCFDLVDFHESTQRSDIWVELAREATAFSPDSLARAILSTDVVKYIGKSLRGEHDYRANPEVLSDKLMSLLELGLNDAIPGWNETKLAELQKYSKAQKRAGRKVRKTKSEVILPIDTVSESQPESLQGSSDDSAA